MTDDIRIAGVPVQSPRIVDLGEYKDGVRWMLVAFETYGGPKRDDPLRLVRYFRHVPESCAAIAGAMVDFQWDFGVHPWRVYVDDAVREMIVAERVRR